MDNDKNKQLSPEENSRESIESQSQSELAVEENKVKIISPGRMVLKRFFRSKLSVVGLVTLIILFAFSIFGPFFSKAVWGYGENTPDLRMTLPVIRDYEITHTLKAESDEGILAIAKYCLNGKDYDGNDNDEFRFIAPKRDEDGNITEPSDSLTRLIKNNVSKLNEKYKGKQGEYRHTNGETYYFEIEMSLGSGTIYFLEKLPPSADTNNDGVIDDNDLPTYSRMITTIIKRTSSAKILNLDADPTSDHWLGTDSNGFDIFTRLMYGGRISLTLSFVVVIIEVILGIIFGGLAGYFGKWVDLVIMRVIDILDCLPGIPLMLIFSSILDGLAVEQSVRIFFLMGMLSLLGWTGITRTVRGQILMLREQEFMVAAEALGLSVPRRIIKHLVPNVMPLLIVGMTLGLGGVILSEATLSFLGLGIRQPQAAWGTMINTANDPIILQYHPNQWIPAGILIVMVVLAFNFVGDGLRDAFDPKSRR